MRYFILPLLLVLLFSPAIPYTGARHATGAESGVVYEAGRWFFDGVVVGMAQERRSTVDLVRVRYARGTVWVTSGALQPDGTYLSAGSWGSRREMRAALRAGTQVRVYAGSPEEPVSTPSGVDWAACTTAWCRFAQETEALWTFSEGFSTVFVRSGLAPGWYPWGYLPWHIVVR